MVVKKQMIGRGKGKNEDAVYIEDKAGCYLCMGIADGQSGKTYCLEGARCTLECVFDYLKHSTLADLKKYYNDELQYQLICRVRATLAGLAKEKDSDIYEFSSTFCTMVIDDQTGMFMTANLGDGTILGVTNTNVIVTLSYPEHGATNRSTYLTTTDGALSHIRIGWGNISDYHTILLFSDGVKGIVTNGYINHEVAKMLIRKEHQKLLARIEGLRMQDDASIIFFSTDSEK